MVQYACPLCRSRAGYYVVKLDLPRVAFARIHYFCKLVVYTRRCVFMEYKESQLIIREVCKQTLSNAYL